ncbi:MAG: GNAT family N-acetyltransferase [Eubacteriales bacterium]|nr:GNAT family N-acetyltransferase [Eubacteriales bacterium]
MRIDFPTPERVPQLKALWELAFGDSRAVIDAFFSTAYAPERCRCVTMDGQATAALYWFDTECGGQKLAYLYAVATHPAYRHRGLCRALIGDTHALLAGLGYEGALLMPAQEGLRRMYGAMGYRDCCNVSVFDCAAGVPVPLKKVSTGEFARLRREFLPRGGVIQEGETLNYLATYAAFYAGTDFLLAASAGDGQLWGMELLGNRDAAPGILGALGYPRGTFRTPGSGIPFAMFHPLKPDAMAPAYFGLELN